MAVVASVSITFGIAALGWLIRAAFRFVFVDRVLKSDYDQMEHWHDAEEKRAEDYRTRYHKAADELASAMEKISELEASAKKAK